MLIIPVDTEHQRRTIPWVCISLLIVNTIIFALCSQQDNQRPPPFDQDGMALLSERESPLLLDWLSHTDTDRYSRAMSLPAGPQRMWQFGWGDSAFTDYVHQAWQSQPPDARWRQLRAQLESWLANDSSHLWGLVPNQTSLVTLFSYQFMHGSWTHLLGNMICLLLFGIAMERYWGPLRFLGAYLIGGLGSGLFFVATHWHSGIPLVGASGSIASLMGLFAGTYGLRRLEFFYSIGVFFGSFKAPALALFPVWLLWELLQAVISDAAVAYTAHAGGIISGLLLALLLRMTRHAPPTEQPHGGVKHSAVPARCLQLAEQLQYAQAQQHCQQQLDQHTDSKELWSFFLDMGGRQGKLLPAFMHAIKTLGSEHRYDTLLQALWQNVEQDGGNIDALPPAYKLLLAELALRRQQVSRCRQLTEQLLASHWQHPRLARLNQLLAAAE
ncbi:MAG: rhomboid family intramembrane serine protease [Alcanivorax sp.]|nr:rhomboid family intramembrane serine protease [Alcanivorax sp.]